MNVSSSGPAVGPADAPVTLIEFADFQCPYCARALPVIAEVRERFPTQLRVVFKHMPLDSIHPYARPAARAAVCAEKQDKFWPYHDVLFQNVRALGTDQLRAHADTAGLDLAAFDACLATPEPDARRQRRFRGGQERRGHGNAGLRAERTPCCAGCVRPDDLAERIERALADAGAPRG